MTPDETTHHLENINKIATRAVLSGEIPDANALTYVGLLIEVVALIDSLDEHDRIEIEPLRQAVANHALRVANEHRRRTESTMLAQMFAAPDAQVPPSVA